MRIYIYNQTYDKHENSTNALQIESGSGKRRRRQIESRCEKKKILQRKTRMCFDMASLTKLSKFAPVSTLTRLASQSLGTGSYRANGFG